MKKDIHISFLADYYGSLLSQKSLEILRLYYDKDYSLSEIAELHSITRQGVRDYLKKAATTLLKLESNLRFVERIDGLKKNISLQTDILDTSSDIKAVEVSKHIKELIQNF